MVRTREAERRVEDLYREALEHMFRGSEYTKLIDEERPPPVRDCLDFVITRIKHRRSIATCPTPRIAWPMGVKP
jgi:hypothetical protein